MARGRDLQPDKDSLDSDTGKAKGSPQKYASGVPHPHARKQLCRGPGGSGGPTHPFKLGSRTKQSIIILRTQMRKLRLSHSGSCHTHSRWQGQGCQGLSDLKPEP